MTYLYFHNGAFYDSRICGAVVVQEIDPEWDGEGEPRMIDREISPSKIPAGAVEITEAERDAVFAAAQAAGKIIQAGPDGRPVVVDLPPPTPERQEELARLRRDQLMKDSDWVIFRAWETNTQPPAEVVTYRTALRQLPEQPGWPIEIEWPELPPILVS